MRAAGAGWMAVGGGRQLRPGAGLRGADRLRLPRGRARRAAALVQHGGDAARRPPGRRALGAAARAGQGGPRPDGRGPRAWSSSCAARGAGGSSRWCSARSSFLAILCCGCCRPSTATRRLRRPLRARPGPSDALRILADGAEQQGADGAVPADPDRPAGAALADAAAGGAAHLRLALPLRPVHLLGPVVPVRRRPRADRRRRDDRGRAPAARTGARRRAGIALAAAVLGTLALVPQQALPRSGTATSGGRRPETAAVDRALDKIPTGSRVAASDTLGGRIALRTELYIIGRHHRRRRPAAARLGVRRGGVGRLRPPGYAARRSRPGRASRRCWTPASSRWWPRSTESSWPSASSAASSRGPSSVPAHGGPDLPRLCGVRRVAHLLRLRAHPPDEPASGSTSPSRSPSSSAYSTGCRGCPPRTPPRTTWPPCTAPP